ncbi:hypothetical protein CSV67_08200 [Sporosarcina sp. P2]|uniref:TylF/MycF/NovP-related O-methyltransferase n=1 Tax=Sporosarcina sp. P2 TaxID=2048251 RepID=UPI000C171FAA|nr:TylF/MycF/NovP-related O-methyltransferase [Sporosarcina sp. P2]PID02607.1 hypothetical protein CSV67_08200 [Sporosarcina sp. P2]
MKKLKVIIFGTSIGSEILEEIIDFTKIDIVCYLDNDTSKQGSTLRGVTIMKPDSISAIDFDYILLGSKTFYAEMTKQLISLGIDNNKVLNPIILPKIRKAKGLIQETHKQNKIASIVKEEYFSKYFQDYAITTMQGKSIDRNKLLYDYPDYLLKGIDYVRISTVELLSKEILERDIPGEIAELGVYRGDFSKLISKLFPYKKFYLFDTFEGFSEKDVYLEGKRKLSIAKTGHLDDTSIDIVINKVTNKERIVVKKGYFPDTTEGLKNERFSFVSIDVDLYKPTYEGLCYFYERLSKGGYIIVHDYNFDFYSGVKVAVREFAEKYNVSYVPVSDYHGSIIITK